MFCPNCGSKLGEDVSFCHSCGYKLTKKSENAPTERNLDTHKAPSVEEVKKAPDHRDDTDKNIIALIGFILSFVSPVPGIVCSAIGLKYAKENGGIKYNFAKAGLIIGIVSTALVVLIFTVAIITEAALLFHYFGTYQDLEHTSAALRLMLHI
ncbi:MAG: zinc-ribbon domain-containing protein [Clostridiales bacterium]|nr:zinc-ribbon domain-containing protein [Clostridiales bacterium]